MRPPGWRGRTMRRTGRANFSRFRGCIADIVRHLSRVEDVHLLVNDAAAEQRAQGMLKRLRRQPGAGAVSSVADEPGLAAGFGADLCEEQRLG